MSSRRASPPRHFSTKVFSLLDIYAPPFDSRFDHLPRDSMEDADVPTSRVVAFDMAVNVVPFVDSLAIPGFPTLLTLKGPDRNHLVEVTRIRSRNPHRPAPPSEPLLPLPNRGIIPIFPECPRRIMTRFAASWLYSAPMIRVAGCNCTKNPPRAGGHPTSQVPPGRALDAGAGG